MSSSGFQERGEGEEAQAPGSLGTGGGWEVLAQGLGALTAEGLPCLPSWCALITETAGSLKVPARTSRPKHRPSPSR